MATAKQPHQTTLYVRTKHHLQVLAAEAGVSVQALVVQKLGAKLKCWRELVLKPKANASPLQTKEKPPSLAPPKEGSQAGALSLGSRCFSKPKD